MVIEIHTCISQKIKDPVLVYNTMVLKKLKKSNDQSENHRFFHENRRFFHTCNFSKNQTPGSCIQSWFSKILKFSDSWPENHHLFHENRRFLKGSEIKGTDSCLILIFFFFSFSNNWN